MIVLRFPELVLRFLMISSALRIPLAVTWLTVYRQLQIPVKVWLGPAFGGNYVWPTTLWLRLTFYFSVILT